MERFTIERAFGRFVPAFEYTAIQAAHLLGSDRTAIAGGWVDTIGGNRAAGRHRLHARARYGWSRHQLSANYEWIAARDNGDGPFSFPEQAGNLSGEWARSAGLAPHNVSVIGSFALPGAVSVNISDTWHNGSPFNITTGLDAAGNGLYVDRGGRARNSGDGPWYNLMSLYAYRRVSLPQAVLRGRLHLNLGVQADNVLDNRNYTSLGSIAGSASFGRPLAAFPGRSVRVYVNVD